MAKILLLSPTSYRPRNSCNLVLANFSTLKKNGLFFFFKEPYQFSSYTFLGSFCRKTFFPSVYFLAERTVCVHLYPTLHMTKLQRGCFSESKGYYGCEPTTTQQALQREGFLLQVLIHTQAHAGSEKESRVWHQVELRNSLCIASQRCEPLVHSTVLLAPKEANATIAPAATTGLC